MDIKKIVYDYASYDEGLTDNDIKNLITENFKDITYQDYLNFEAVNTCVIIDGNVINYHNDVINTIYYILNKK